MPLLPKETDLFPSDLLAPEYQSDVPREWWTMYTRVRQEKALSRELLAWQIPFYLPLVKQSHLHRGRKRSSYLPLFSSYVFVHCTDEERIRALATDRIAQNLAVADPAALVHDLRQIQRLIAAEVPLTIESKLQPGARVRVKTGVLVGLEGVVQARTKPTKLVVLVNMLAQGVSLEVEDFVLDRID